MNATINLSNIKPNASKTVNEVVITKGSGQYTLADERRTASNATLAYDKDSKAWQFTVTGGGSDHTITLQEATSKTAFDLAIEAWDSYEAVAASYETSTELAVIEPEVTEDEVVEAEVLEPEATQEVEAEEAEVVEAVIVSTGDAVPLDYRIETKGGHGPHRAAAVARLLRALGAAPKISIGKGSRYREDLITVHVLDDRDEVERLEAILDQVMPELERRAHKACREVSHQARTTGQHHSHLGALARRGYIRGFAAGIHDMVTETTALATAEDELDAQAFDKTQWQEGYNAGAIYATIELAWLTPDNIWDTEDSQTSTELVVRTETSTDLVPVQ